ncbi:hypothetical protein [Massilia aquatica]|uniref:Uncharacterized protein n=1 Tax=Massilia aquatica TaxID=2609000 RepID=A0ABX0MCR9_9BURK|nr:hypothetical protein [Massilia aquatica]NHZ44862.1 hypothetical protein [Massilia aquatica]
MKLSPLERENLLAPLVIGAVIGLACALSVASISPDQYMAGVETQGRPLHEILLAFFIGVNVAFIPFGVIPVLISRVYAKIHADAGSGPASS